MSVNKYQSHLLLLPEDDAIRQIANGFLLDPSVQTTRVQVLPASGGWKHVVDDFKTSYAPTMARFSLRYIVFLIDFDNQPDRIEQVRREIPDECADRVFILGIASEAEDLRRALGLSFEKIGKCLADDCRDKTTTFWGHDLLRENAPEVDRLQALVNTILHDHD